MALCLERTKIVISLRNSVHISLCLVSVRFFRESLGYIQVEIDLSSRHDAFSMDARSECAGSSRWSRPSLQPPASSGHACSPSTSSLLFACFVNFVVPPLRLSSPSPHQPVPANRESPLRQPPLPPLACADRRRLVEQAVPFLLPGQPGELGRQRCPGGRNVSLRWRMGGLVLLA